MDGLIVLSNVSKIYGAGSPQQICALDHVNLILAHGEFTALVGPSGSGKSTLLHLMSGLDSPSEGRIQLAGRDLAGMSEGALADFRRDHIGLVFQSYNLIPVLTVAENVEYVLLLQRVSSQERRARVATILRELGLAGFERKMPHELSGGQQQRVAVARAVVARPSLILADEPTANLDSVTGSKLIDLMEELNRVHGVTFIFSTHDPKIMERAHRTIRLEDGRVKAS